MSEIKSSQICASEEDLSILLDANVYTLEDVEMDTDDEVVEGVNIVFKLSDGYYANLTIYEDGTTYLSNKY